MGEDELRVCVESVRDRLGLAIHGHIVEALFRVCCQGRIQENAYSVCGHLCEPCLSD